MGWSNTRTASDMTPMEALADWDIKARALEAAKAAEAEARNKAFALAFPNPREGTNTFDLPNGYKLKGTHKISRKFVVPASTPKPHPDKEPTVLDAVEHLTNRLTQQSNEGSFIAERLIKYTASLSDGEYKKLPETLRELVDEYIESSIGTPTLKVEAPKKG